MGRMSIVRTKKVTVYSKRDDTKTYHDAALRFHDDQVDIKEEVYSRTIYYNKTKKMVIEF